MVANHYVSPERVCLDGPVGQGKVVPCDSPEASVQLVNAGGTIPHHVAEAHGLGDGDGDGLDGLKKAEIVALAAAEGVEVASGATKAELIAAVRAARADAA